MREEGERGEERHRERLRERGGGEKVGGRESRERRRGEKCGVLSSSCS